MNRKRFSIEQQLNTIGKYLNILNRKQKKKKGIKQFQMPIHKKDHLC